MPSHSLNIGSGIPKGVAHPCPIERMIDFVENKLSILNLKSVDEINEYLDDHHHRTECSFGFLNLKFYNRTINFIDLIKLFLDTINNQSYIHNPDSCYQLLKKITSYYEEYKEKSKESIEYDSRIF